MASTMEISKWERVINLYNTLQDCARDTVNLIEDDRVFCDEEWEMFGVWYALKGFTDDDWLYVEACGYDRDLFDRDDGVYVVIKQYAAGDDDTFAEYEYKEGDSRGIYDKMMELTGGDVEIAVDATGWCDLADVGDVYEFREGEIEIMEID